MAVNLVPMGELLPIEGIRVGAAEAGVRYRDRLDLAVWLLDPGAVVGGVFTQSTFRAPPVVLAARRCGEARALVANSGNANAATGERGLSDAEESCAHLGQAIGAAATSVLPFSTGVIGEFLDMDAMRRGIDAAVAGASSSGWADGARAIMTTDTAPKALSRTFEIDGESIAATGMVKGSGMIRPDMATMLAFLGTDARVTPMVANQLAKDLADCSFNRLTIDGDTSTNDSFVVMASGKSGPLIDATSSSTYAALLDGLKPVVIELAERTVRDGEGATKFVTVEVNGGRDEAECLDVAYTIAHSPLVKTAIFAGDPNWGRFCMAIGRAPVADLDPNRVSLFLDDVQIAADGLVAATYEESKAAAVMQRDEYVVRVELGRGGATGRVWTSDLSYEYVKINAEYRT